MRWTCRKLGGIGMALRRERCWTSTPKWLSPSTPRPAMRVISSKAGLEKVCVGDFEMEITIPDLCEKKIRLMSGMRW